MMTPSKPSIFPRENECPANPAFCCCYFFLGNIDNFVLLSIQNVIFETPLERERPKSDISDLRSVRWGPIAAWKY